MTSRTTTNPNHSPRRRFGLILGLVLFSLLAFLPISEIPEQPRRMMALTALMAVWWVSEALPLAVTSLLPMILLPTLGLASASQAAAPYSNHLVYLFMGGFMLAQAMQRWNLHRRVALTIVSAIGTSPSRVILGFMTATAFLSMWVSNTATTAMMMPIALAVVQQASQAIEQARTVDDSVSINITPGEFHFGAALMLGIAYASSIGGISTLIGTPPNVFLAGTMLENHEIELSFVQWLGFGLPFSVVFLPIVWLVLTRFIFPLELKELPGGVALIRADLAALGPMKKEEKRLAVIFTLTALAWTFRPVWSQLFEQGRFITDSTIAMAATVACFMVPADNGERILNWQWASKIPWDVLILFGGGFSLATGFERSGLSQWVGEQLEAVSSAPLPLFVVVVVLVIITLTEFASNVASTAMSLPILAATAESMGLSPLTLCIPATVAASCAFMLPAATPPNAIVFGTGYFTIPQMVRAGIWINLIAIVLTSLFSLLLVGPLFGV